LGFALKVSLPQTSVCDSREYNFIVKKAKKCAGLTQEIGSYVSNSCRLPRLVKKGATQLCTCKKKV
jgi:hypothetical protein